MTDINQTLEQRVTTHGSFAENSVLIQKMKDIIRQSPNYDSMTYFQKEAIDMIIHKLGRITYGNPFLLDSWRDIAGYSQLVVNELQNHPKACDVCTEIMYLHP